jgi:3-hydroxyisobutyrate dehydrogenase
MLVSGDAAQVEALTPALSAMTGKLSNLGPRPEAAAAFKLMGNLFLMFLTTGLSDLLSLAKAMDVSPTDASKLFDIFNPGATIGARMKRITDANFGDASWELSMARKDARIMLEEAERASVPLQVLPAIAARMDAVIAAGHGSDDWTVLAKESLP